MADFKKLSAVDAVNEVRDTANILIEENGVIKKAPKEAMRGVSSWNDLQDKPFYAEKAFADITWDGDTTGRVTVDIGGGVALCKVSDQIMSTEDLVGSIVEGSDGGTLEVVEDAPFSPINDLIFIGDAGALYVVLVLAPTELDGVTFTEVGTYFMFVPDFFIKSLRKEIIHKLDTKFLPESSVVIVCDSNWTLLYTSENLYANLRHMFESGIPKNIIICEYSSDDPYNNYFTHYQYNEICSRSADNYNWIHIGCPNARYIDVYSDGTIDSFID